MKDLEFLESLETIPQIRQNKRTLMDITGIKHHETLWSYIYMFFLNPNEEHGIGDLFIRSLEKLIGIEGPFLEDFEIKEEVVVEDDKRIDLLLTDKRNDRAIIIENKVNHYLNNDLNLYYRSIHESYDDVRVIVLGLKKYELKEYSRGKDIPHLYSVTHKEFIDAVMKKITPSESHFHYLLSEFYETILNYSNHMDKDILNLFGQNDNARKIFRLHEIYKSIRDNVSSTLSGNNPEAPGLRPYLQKKNMNIDECKGKNYLKYYFTKFKCDNRVMLTVIYSRIWNYSENDHPHIYVILELQKEIKDFVYRNSEIADCIKAPYINKGIIFDGDIRDTYWHFAGIRIELPNLVEDLLPSNLEEIMKTFITEQCPLIKMGEDILLKYRNSRDNQN